MHPLETKLSSKPHNCLKAVAQHASTCRLVCSSVLTSAAFSSRADATERCNTRRAAWLVSRARMATANPLDSSDPTHSLLPKLVVSAAAWAVITVSSDACFEHCAARASLSVVVVLRTASRPSTCRERRLTSSSAASWALWMAGRT